MLFTDLNVTFKFDSDQEERTFLCTKVVFALELIGHIDEMFDFTLKENYEDARQDIEIWVKLNQEESIWMKDFLIASDKKLIIDGTTYEVVNAEKKIDFPLFRDTPLGTFPKMKFRRKQLGVLDPSVLIGDQNQNA